MDFVRNKELLALASEAYKPYLLKGGANPSEAETEPFLASFDIVIQAVGPRIAELVAEELEASKKKKKKD